MTKRTAKGLVTIPLAIAVLAVFAPAAWAHTASATISCKKVIYSYADFPALAGDTVHETVYINGLREKTDRFIFTGPTGRNTIRIGVSGSASVQAVAQWNTNGAKGSYEVTQEVTGCVIG
jgi:hypothetical protein